MSVRKRSWITWGGREPDNDGLAVVAGVGFEICFPRGDDTSEIDAAELRVVASVPDHKLGAWHAEVEECLERILEGQGNL